MLWFPSYDKAASAATAAAAAPWPPSLSSGTSNAARVHHAPPFDLRGYLQAAASIALSGRKKVGWALFLGLSPKMSSTITVVWPALRLVVTLPQ